MTKNYFKALASAALLLCGLTATAQSLTDSEVTATWVFDQGTTGQTATITPESSSNYFKNTYESHDEEFFTLNKKTYKDCTETLFKPAKTYNEATTSNAVNFMLVPQEGLMFTPTEVSLIATRIGTNGGKIDVTWVNPDGTTVSLASKVEPGRNKEVDLTTFSYTVTGATVAEGECGLRINIHSINGKDKDTEEKTYSKELGLANIVIKGKLNGTAATEESVTVSEAGYATYAPSANVTLPAGVEAYAVTLDGESLTTAKLASGAVLGAGQGYLLKATAGTYALPITKDEATAVDGNSLKAAKEAVTADGSQYALKKLASGNVGFAKVQTGVSIPAGKAYLNLTAGAKVFYSLDGISDVTAINAAIAEGNANGDYYTLQGTKTAKPQRGLYIKDGKKILKK